MATDQIAAAQTRPTSKVDRNDVPKPSPRSQPPVWKRVLAPLASLKLTVVLMALSIFIVLAGTFAQTRVDIWDAIREYFRIDLAAAFNSNKPFVHLSELFVWIDWKLFFPASFFPDAPAFPEGLQWLAAIWPTQTAIQNAPNALEFSLFGQEIVIGLGVWFPRGWTIGVVMIANLLAAHLVRFKLQSEGPRLWGGLGLIVLGVLVTWAVVATHNQGVIAESWMSYDLLWGACNFGLFVLAATCAYRAVASESMPAVARRWLGGGGAALFGLGALGLYIGTPAPESMRILYQLIKGGLASLVLLAGCLLVFRKRAGIVLLHGGIGLLMAYEVLVGTQHIETQMVIPEGEVVTFSHDQRGVELAVVDPSDPHEERHVVIGQSLITDGNVISDERLPFDIKVLEYIPNGFPERLKPGEKSIATKGLGRMQQIVRTERSTGTESEVEFPGAYVQLLKKGEGSEESRDMGVYMLSTATDPALHLFPFVEKVEVAGAGEEDAASDTQTYELALRFIRYYKDYGVELVDFQKNDYAGTTHARDFRSIVNFYDVDGEKLLDRYEIWMNNPLRWSGETFYQGSFRPASATPTTILQVVENEGWMAPYVACMIVALGMFFQFGLGLLRFVDRRTRVVSETDATDKEAEVEETGFLGRHRWMYWGVPLSVAVFVGLSLLSYGARQRTVVKEDFQLSAFADLPVVMGGRSLPLESLAMMRLMQISDLQSFKEKDPDPTDGEDPKSQPASKWLLDMIARPEIADEYPAFRIENDVIARTLGLEIAESRRYAYADFEEKLPELRKQMQQLKESKKPKTRWTVEERKRAELLNKVSQYLDVRSWFGSLEPQIRQDFPELYTEESSRLQRASDVLGMVRRLQMFAEESKEFRVPLVIPLHIGEAEGSLTRFENLERRWESYPVATGFHAMDEALEVTPSPAVEKFEAITTAWKEQDAEAFNEAVAEYRTLLESATPEQLEVGTTEVNLPKSDFEGYFHRIGPFNLLSFAYVFALLLTLAGWGASGLGSSGWGRVLQRSALWTIVALFGLHTLAIIARVYISGRPPVTNLYSSAIFIGWAAVLMGIIYERVFRLGVGNAVAAVAGFTTLRIAHALMSDGDTLGVVEAVLDTQFWLATHVVCITIGYAATYVAGLFGLLYILRGSRIGLVTLGVLAVVGGGIAARTESSTTMMVGSGLLLGGLISLGLGVRSLTGRGKGVEVDVQKTITRMTYGTICGAAFLSFVGTVLGGLWADDSWGRFWGWDPKENGALIIVLWNALILHARWDGLVRDRGLAALAVIGNIVTSWSWFGVNELGIGLHSYGFTEGRLFWLMAFCLSQLVIVAVALLPRRLWWSEQRVQAS